MKEAIIINIKEIKSDLESAEQSMESSRGTTDYLFWSGVASQSRIVLQRLEKTFDLLARTN